MDATRAPGAPGGPPGEAGAPSGPDRVAPRVLKGFRDLLPGEMLVRNRIVRAACAVYERYGFAPLETPALEHLDVLLGKYGDEGTKELFRLETPEGDTAALRYDLTVPLARVVAAHPDLPRPFRRYQVGTVWRTDKPGPGRFREFLQLDIDTVGSAATAADVEIVAAVCEVFAELGLDDVTVRLSSRRLLDAMVRWAGVPAERATDVFRVLDKLDRQGLDNVLLELTAGRIDASGDRIPGLGLAPAQVEAIGRFLAIAPVERPKTIAAVASLLAGGEGVERALVELGEMDVQLRALGLGDDRVRIEPALARGLAYYTGPVFEAVLARAPEVGSVAGGGRYDGLVERFLGTAIPATGAAIGVDRLASVLVRVGAVAPRPTPTRVLVTALDPGLLPEYQRIAAELRGAGFPTEVWLGEGRGLKKQLAYADRIGAEVAVLLGGDELARGEVSVKDLVEGARRGGEAQAADRGAYLQARFGQRAVPRTELLATIRGLLERGA